MTESERFPSHTTAMTDLHLHRCAGVGFLLLGILAADPTAGQAASLLRWSSVLETLRHSLHWRPLDLAGVATKVPLALRFPEKERVCDTPHIIWEACNETESIFALGFRRRSQVKDTLRKTNRVRNRYKVRARNKNKSTIRQLTITLTPPSLSRSEATLTPYLLPGVGDHRRNQNTIFFFKLSLPSFRSFRCAFCVVPQPITEKESVLRAWPSILRLNLLLL